MYIFEKTIDMIIKKVFQNIHITFGTVNLLHLIIIIVLNLTILSGLSPTIVINSLYSKHQNTNTVTFLIFLFAFQVFLYFFFCFSYLFNRIYLSNICQTRQLYELHILGIYPLKRLYRYNFHAPLYYYTIT